jgi:hypothetical protein
MFFINNRFLITLKLKEVGIINGIGENKKDLLPVLISNKSLDI